MFNLPVKETLYEKEMSWIRRSNPKLNKLSKSFVCYYEDTAPMNQRGKFVGCYENGYVYDINDKVCGNYCRTYDDTEKLYQFFKGFTQNECVGEILLCDFGDGDIAQISFPNGRIAAYVHQIADGSCYIKAINGFQKLWFTGDIVGAAATFMIMTFF